MANLQSIIRLYNRVTTNQALLFDRLLVKYARQLRKHQIDANSLQELSWKTPVIESTTEYTGARVSLDEKLVIRVPFNKQFITFFGTKVNNNPFAWNKDSKMYTADFSTYALKTAYKILPKFFETVTYCDRTQTIINELEKYSAKFWNPTLTLINDRPMIMAVNQILADQLNGIEITITPECISKLVNLGIEIDSAIYSEDSLMTLAASIVSEVEISEIEQLIENLARLKFESVVLGRAMPPQLNRQEICNLILQHGMQPVDLRTDTSFEGRTAMLQHTSDIMNSLHVFRTIEKIIVIKNSHSIGIK